LSVHRAEIQLDIRHCRADL